MEDLLSHARPVASRRQRGPLEPVLAAATRNCSALAAKLGVTIEQAGQAGDVELLQVAGRLEEGFYNLLENACRHTPSGRRVALRLGPGPLPDWIRVEVQDEGPGFTQEALERGFEPFFTRRRGGTGLGLAIAQRIVEEHGGRIRVRSAPGEGTAITLRLPLAGPGPKAAEPAPAAPAEATA